MLNHIALYGRLTRDPELRYTQNQTPVVSFSIACERDYKPEGGERETDYIDIVGWRHTAEFVSKYFGKGDPIIVDGRLQIRDWTDRDGNKRRSAEIVADNVYFAGSKKQNQSEHGGFDSERKTGGADMETAQDGVMEQARFDALPPEAQAFADRWGVNVEDGERF